MRVNFENTTPTTYKQCQSLLAKVRARSASWPARWTTAKKNGNAAAMRGLLAEAEGLGLMMKMLETTELHMRTALLDQEFELNRAARRHTEKKLAGPNFSFNEGLKLRYQRAALEDSRKEIEQKMIRTGVDFLSFAFRDAVAGGVNR